MTSIPGFAILSIGDELLAGQTVNTNASWLGEQIVQAGGRVVTAMTVPDDRHEIRRRVEELASMADHVVVTGGLGPTEDDLTREVVCEILGVELVQAPEQQELIEDRFRKLGREPNWRSLDQAMVPEGIEILLNREGTAPGMIAKIDGTPVYFLPGVHYEMKALFEEVLQTRIRTGDAVVEKNWLTAMIPESELAILLEPVEELCGDGLKLAYLPSSSLIRLRLVAEVDHEGVHERFDRAAREIDRLASDWIISDRGERIEELVGRQLGSLGAALATAESCTGGRIGQQITTVPGAGGWYLGGVVSYNNRIKQELLNVSPETLNTHGAVSERTAHEMALGALDVFDADYAISVTGIAGPDGGTPEKPVGTVFIGIAARDRDGDDPDIETSSHFFRGNRESIRTRSTIMALLLLSRRLQREGAEGTGG